MELLIDLFGYLSIVVHGLTIIAQAIAFGSVFFIALLLRPMARALGAGGAAVERSCERIAAWGAVALLISEAVTVGLQAAVLIGTVQLSFLDILPAEFAVAGIIKMTIAALLALLLFVWGYRARTTVLLVLALTGLAAATLTTHAVARLEDRGFLVVMEWLHQFGAALWIGGIPCFLLTLARLRAPGSLAAVGRRFSRMSMAGVSSILLGGVSMSVMYIGSWDALYGTAYGVMVGAKVAMFLMLLGLGAMNFRLVERLHVSPGTPITRLRRFAEVELGIGISIFLAAASLTSVPPAVDLTHDRVSWAEIAERNTPVWPRFDSPDHDALALPELQAKLDAEAARQKSAPSAAFVPGSGELPPRNAADIAWSEYNHHWAGLFVLAMGALALLHRAGFRWARHWPLLFVLLGVFLFFRSDPETWPLGNIGLVESFRDVEVLQHRFFVLLIFVFALFEWRVRVRNWQNRYAVLAFPLLCAIGGAMLLTHSHAIANIKDQLLIELTHTPLALAGIVAGWARWLEIRLDPRENPLERAIAGWTWPICLVLVGLILLSYREA